MNEPLFERAQAHHRAGQLQDALAAYRELTQGSPEVAAYWRARAIAEHQGGHLETAAQVIAQALQLDSGDAQASLVAGHIAEDRGAMAEAEAHFRRAIEAKADWPAPWSALGTRLLEDGHATEAFKCFQRVVDMQPAAARAWNNLGMAQMALERVDDASRTFNHAVSLDARYALAHFNLARVHELRGETERAQQAARQAAQLEPRHAETQLLLGDIARRQRDFAGAERHFASAASLSPAPKAALTLADLYWEAGHPDRARQLFSQVEQRNPASYKAAVASRLLLPTVYDSAEHLRESRAGYARGLAELRTMSDRFGWKRPGDVLADTRWSNFYLAYQGCNDRDLQRDFGEFVQGVFSRSLPGWLAPRARRETSGRRIRIGFFSFYWYNCTAGRYFMSWILGLDPERFETFVYYTNPWIADDTRTIAAAAATFRHLPGRPLQTIANRVAADELDILVYPELGMNADTFTLASLRLAPVQVAGWGHPTTTGLPTIDWFLSSAQMEPQGAQDHYTERLALLPGLGTRYARPVGDDHDSTRSDFGLPENKHLYLVPQSLFKIHPDNDAIIADVLARDPEACAVLFAGTSDAVTDRFAARLAPALAARGVAMQDRVYFMPYMPHAGYLRLNRLCDVMLDTLHWSGGNTSLDALASGLPVVTLPGELMRGRQSAGMLSMLEMPELVVRDAESYVACAVAIARDKERRQHLAATIESRLDRLFDQDEPLRALAAFLEDVVRL